MNKIIIESELLESLYWGNNLSLDQIAAIFKCNGATIYNWMKFYNIKRRKKTDGLKLRMKYGISSHFRKGMKPWNYKKIKPHPTNCKCCICIMKYHLPITWNTKQRVENARMTVIKNHSQSKENNPNWKGGLTEISNLERKSEEWRNWRKKVFERDNYTCQICGKHGYILHPHHIKKRSEYPILKFEIFNGITLCNSCHSKVHNR